MSESKKKLIEYNDLYKGMKVMDDEGNIGIVKEHDDIHNVLVKFKNGGSGLHCLVEGCFELATMNGEQVKLPSYDPLYYCT
jgi:hypothetical protein